jgi:hypothetical protein
MEETELDIPILQPGEKIIGHAYITEDAEVVFAPHSGAREVVLVEARAGSSGPWAVRRRPLHARAGTAGS